jgi:hypothetical protein
LVFIIRIYHLAQSYECPILDINGVETYCIQCTVGRVCSPLCNTVPTMLLMLNYRYSKFMLKVSISCNSLIQESSISICLLIKSHYVIVCNFSHTRFLDTGVTLYCLISDIRVIFLIKFPAVHAAYLFCDRQKAFHNITLQ